MRTDNIDQIRDSREALNDILFTIYRLQDTDRDTRKADHRLQDQIEHEFQSIDEALSRLEAGEE